MEPKDFVSHTQRLTKRELAELSLRTMEAMERAAGGKGSGNFGHKGRPGEIGGSGDAESPEATVKKQVAALEALRNEISHSSSRYGGPEFDEIQPRPYGLGGQMLGVRGYGEWQVPADARSDPDNEDEDFEDYDWEEPTPATVKDLDSLAERISKQYGVKVTWSAEEKNWISFYAEPAEKKGRSAGGKGSGNFGHGGRPGQVGGSSSEGGEGGADAAILARPSSAYPPARADGLDTQERFKVGGKYTPERQELHRAIIAKHLAGKTPVGKPTATVLGGGPASGKSSLEKAEGISEGNVVLINPDAIKEMLPEMGEGKKVGNTKVSSLVHEESSDVAKMLTQAAVDGKYNLVLDGTGDSSVEKLGGKVAVMRAGGHEVIGKYVSLPTDMAVRLANERGEKTGRYVPETYLRQTHAAVSNTFAEALKQGLFDRADLYDTTEFGNMRKVVSSTGKNVTIHNQELWDRFLAKGRES